MNWAPYLNGFKSYLKLERSLSGNSVEAYLRDVRKLIQYLEENELDLSPAKIALSHLRDFSQWVNKSGQSAYSQARIISGIKSFYKYLLLENIVQDNPSLLLESPRIGRKLPDVLSIDEISRIIASVDLSKDHGERDKAMLETLYSSGLRVSELVNLKISNVYFDTGFLKIIGKGNKERLVPLGGMAIQQIKRYVYELRNHVEVQAGHEDFVFLNFRGKKLSRMSIFNLIKSAVKTADIRKVVSPHTFRHSFATHLMDGGADLRAVQEMLGHESITTTEIYTHLDRDYLRDAILQFHPRSGMIKSKEKN